MAIKMDIGNNIRDIRKEKKTTLQQVADVMDILHNSFHNMRVEKHITQTDSLNPANEYLN